MLRKIVTALIAVPLAVILVVFAVANRHLVTVGLDPFSAADPATGITLPLFLVLIVVAILGVLAGSAATWLRQRRWRRAARRHEAEAREWRGRYEDAQSASAQTFVATLPRSAPPKP